MTWWIWIVAGIAMIVSEFAVPAFVICFFGAGAVLTGLLLLLCPGIGLAWQLLIFSIASIAFTLTGRKLFAGSRNGRMEDPDQDAVSGETATVAEAIAPDRPGKVEFRGSFWTAVSDRELAAGQLVFVIKRDNLTLTVSDKKL